MVESILKKYGKIISAVNGIFNIELKKDPDFFLEEIEKELPEYTVELIEQRGKNIKIKVQKDLFKAMLNKIKTYKDGVPAEDLKYSDEE